MKKGHRNAGPHVRELMKLLTSDPRIAESNQTLISSLNLLPSGGLSHSVMICSTQPREGKTTIAVSVAIGMALNGKNVLIVDADLRRPRIHEILGIENREGFAELLSGKRQTADVVRTIDVGAASVRRSITLKVISSGKTHVFEFNRAGPTRVKKVVELLETSHDLVIFDTPPVLAVDDALYLAPVVSGIVLVVEAGSVLENEAKLAKQRLAEAGGTVLGFVFNRFEDERHGPGDHPYRSYYQKLRR